MTHISAGSLLKTLGAATEKAWSPQCLYFDLGTSSNSWLIELRALPGLRTVISSDKYEGARPLRALKSYIKSLKSMEITSPDNIADLFVKPQITVKGHSQVSDG